MLQQNETANRSSKHDNFTQLLLHTFLFKKLEKEAPQLQHWVPNLLLAELTELPEATTRDTKENFNWKCC